MMTLILILLPRNFPSKDIQRYFHPKVNGCVNREIWALEITHVDRQPGIISSKEQMQSRQEMKLKLFSAKIVRKAVYVCHPLCWNFKLQKLFSMVFQPGSVIQAFLIFPHSSNGKVLWNYDQVCSFSILLYRVELDTLYLLLLYLTIPAFRSLPRMACASLTWENRNTLGTSVKQVTQSSSCMWIKESNADIGQSSMRGLVFRMSLVHACEIV